MVFAAVLLLAVGFVPTSFAYRVDWEHHDGQQVMGGMKGTVKVMSPTASCSNLDVSCLFEGLTPQYDGINAKGAVGVGWIKMKDSTGNWRIWDAFYLNDKPISYKVYTLAYEETSNVPVDRFFRVGKTTTDGSGTTWYRHVYQSAGSGMGSGLLYSDTKTFTNLSLGHPRVSAWTSSTSTELSTSGVAATFSNIEARHLSGSGWVTWAYNWITRLCHQDSPYWVHYPSHSNDKLVHMGRSGVSGESNECVYGSTGYVDTLPIN
jgi:hypothetical protein